MEIKVIRPIFTSQYCFLNSLPPNEIHVYILHWRSMADWIKENWKMMEKEEIERYTSFVRYEDMMRGALGRIAVKKISSSYLGKDAKDIQIKCESFGKPYLCCSGKRLPINYNLSHSGEIVMVAFGQNIPIGVDVQEIKQIQEYQRLAEYYFSPEERAADSFFKYWTAKEAYVKAIGYGLYKDLASFSVKIGGVSSEKYDNLTWQICQIAVDKGHKACLSYGMGNENELWEEIETGAGENNSLLADGSS